MTIGVRLVARKGFKGYCRSCRKTLKNRELVAFVKEAAPQRCYHLGCSWRHTRLGQQMMRGVEVDIPEGLPADLYPVIRAQLGVARAEARAHADREAKQAECFKKRHLELYPVGTRLVHVYSDRRVRFVEVVAYSIKGHSVTLREVESVVLDTWVTSDRPWSAMPARWMYTLRQACWQRKTERYHHVHTRHFGSALIRGRDYDLPLNFDPHAIQEVEPAELVAGTHVVNVRSVSGSLWYSAPLGHGLSVAGQLHRRIADAIKLFYHRGTVILMHREVRLGFADSLLGRCQDETLPLELTCIVRETPSWPRCTVTGRPMPYGYTAHQLPVYNESLALDASLEVE